MNSAAVSFVERLLAFEGAKCTVGPLYYGHLGTRKDALSDYIAGACPHSRG